MINIIAAVDSKYGIGKDGDIPWKCTTDLKRFKSTTRNSFLLMGSKTWESLPKIEWNSRRVIIISSDKNKYINNLSFTSIEDALEWYDKRNYYLDNDKNLWIAGGESIYNSFIEEEHLLSRLKYIYLTKIPGDYNCDRFFNNNFDFLDYSIEINNECSFIRYEMK